MAITYTAVHPVRRPEGRPTPDDFTFVSGPVPELEAGQVLVENLLLSVDPYMREALEFDDWQEGFGMEGRSLGRVIDSRRRISICASRACSA